MAAASPWLPGSHIPVREVVATPHLTCCVASGSPSLGWGCHPWRQPSKAAGPAHPCAGGHLGGHPWPPKCCYLI